MKVILKPAGVAIVLGAFSALVYLALPRKAQQPTAVPAPTAATGAVTNAKPTAGAGQELSTRPAVAVNWTGAKRILAPNITGPNWRQLTSKGKAENKVVPATVAGHPFARRITVTDLGSNPWDVQIAHPLDVAFKKGSHVRLTYWGRSKDRCTVAAVVEQAAEPYTKIATRVTKLTPEWKQYAEEWAPTADTEPGWAHIDFQVAYQTGELELTGVELVAVN
jgi:Carbohydrate binding domain